MKQIQFQQAQEKWICYLNFAVTYLTFNNSKKIRTENNYSTKGYLKIPSTKVSNLNFGSNKSLFFQDSLSFF